jgi:hypothetical protein
VGSALAWLFAPAQFPAAWLAAVVCFMGWPLGSLALVFIHALTGGAWGYAIRPQLQAGIRTLPLLLPAVIPIGLALHLLYPWMRPDVAAHLHNRFYLNLPFFVARALLYLIVWLGLGWVTLRTLHNPDAQRRLYRLGPPALILLALTVTFAAIDYTLSMEPQYPSSVYGMLVCTEAVLFALSIAVAGLALGSRDTAVSTRHVLGRLLFSLLVLWAYLDFMQLLIVWNSDLPHEAVWYLHRLAGDWKMLAVLIAALHFVLPFFVLITPKAQRSRRALGLIAALLVLIEVPRAWWVVIPATGQAWAWSDAVTMLAVLGIALGIALRALRRSSPEEELAHA